METAHVTSRDGTPIAVERFGDGEPVILVAGALQGRAMYNSLAEQLSRHFAPVLTEYIVAPRLKEAR